jgi:hypothetical protein
MTLFFAALLLCAARASHALVDLWVADVNASPQCFRQPLLVVIDSARLVAFAEGRDNGPGLCSAAADGKNSSIWRRTSSDGGASWSPPAMLYDAPPQPDYLSAVFDAVRGRVILQIQTSPNVQLTSDDAGATWSKPAPITVAVPAGFSATPGVAHGIQISGALCGDATCGGAAGRLVVAWVCHAKAAPAAALSGDVSCPGCFSCLATSDDGGATWTINAGAVSTQEGSREASLIQLKSGTNADAVIYATERNMGNATGEGAGKAQRLFARVSNGLINYQPRPTRTRTLAHTHTHTHAQVTDGTQFRTTPGRR